jgi:hypothetical protein
MSEPLMPTPRLAITPNLRASIVACYRDGAACLLATGKVAEARALEDRADIVEAENDRSIAAILEAL